MSEAIIVAGTRKKSNALSIETSIAPTPIPLNTAPLKEILAANPWIPAKHARTVATHASKKVLEFFSVTNAPTIIPKIIIPTKITEFVDSLENIPTSIVKIIPIRKAHAPIEFSFDLITIFYR